MTQKIVVNRCWGGFGLSREAFLKLREMKNKTALEEPDIGEYYKDGSGPRENYIDSFCDEIARNDPDLIKILESLGTKKASAHLAELEIREIPDGIEWTIHDYDGMETVEEAHRSW